MILFQAVTLYHILNAILYKEKYYKDKKVVLILSHLIESKFPNYEDLQKLGIFDEVYLVQVTYGRGITDFLNLFERKFNESVPYKLEDFEEHVIFPGHFYLGPLLAHKEIPFIYGEDGIGFIEEGDRGYDFLSKSNYELAEYARKNGLFDLTSPFIKKIICDNSLTSDNFENEHFVMDFNVFKELKRVPLEFKNKLFFIFAPNGSKEVEIKNNSSLLLTQQLAVLNLISYENQLEYYKLIVDFFIENDIVYLKKHPDDVLPLKQELCSVEVEELDAKIPTELTSLILSGEFDKVVTLYSSSIHSFSNNSKNKVFLGFDILKEIHYIYQIYLVLEYLKLENITKVNYQGLGSNILKEMAKIYYPKLILEKVDCIENNSINLVFENITEDTKHSIKNYYDVEIFYFNLLDYNIYEKSEGFKKPILLEKKHDEEIELEGVVYYNSKGDIRKMDLTIEKFLKNSKINLSSKEINKYEEEIFLLKAENKALEKLLIKIKEQEK